MTPELDAVYIFAKASRTFGPRTVFPNHTACTEMPRSHRSMATHFREYSRGFGRFQFRAVRADPAKCPVGSLLPVWPRMLPCKEMEGEG
jgi:hypothetical protein